MLSPLKSNRLILGSLSSAILSALMLQPAAADTAYEFAKPIENAFKLGQDDAKYGQVKLNLRYRYELADVANNGKETAHANTLRMRLGYLTPKFHGLQGFVEYEGNLAMQQDYRVPKGNWSGNPNRDVVADPQQNELNQLWLSYKAFNTEIKGGRQRIKLDDDRFIGNVGWRQMEQTYDAAVITNQSIENLTLKVGYIGRAQNIFSVQDDMELPFYHINYKFKTLASFTSYGYWLADRQIPTKSTQTLGFTIKGSPKINKDIKVHYRGEYSYQSNHANNPNNFDLNRYHLMLGATVKGITLKAAIEELGSNGAQSFQTPLGTNHAFQGWADLFLTTPKNGVRDVNATLVTKVIGTKLMFVYHNFQSPVGNINYGNEYDFLVTKKFGKHYSLLAKYAYYDADENNGDPAHNKNVHKFWLQGVINF